MHIHDPDWNGPVCRLCTAPVKSLHMLAQHQELWNKLKQEDPEAKSPPHFCSNECVYAKYM